MKLFPNFTRHHLTNKFNTHKKDLCTFTYKKGLKRNLYRNICYKNRKDHIKSQYLLKYTPTTMFLY